MGLEYLQDSRGSKEFRATLFEAIARLLKDLSFHAPLALLNLDSTKARLVLMSKEVFHAENQSIDHILSAFRSKNVSVPSPQLRELLAALKDRAKASPFDRAYGDGLILLARAEGEGAKDLIADAEKWGNDNVREGAAKALEVAAGAVNAYRFVLDIYRQRSAKGLTEPQLDYLTLSSLDGQVRNGGFSQFYFNSSGDLRCMRSRRPKPSWCRNWQRSFSKPTTCLARMALTRIASSEWTN